jgi:hypothetical protein
MSSDMVHATQVAVGSDFRVKKMNPTPATLSVR